MTVARLSSRPPRLLIAITVITIVGGCGYEASLQRETSTGGLVTYPIQNDADVLSSVGRQDALRLIKDKCPHGFRVTKEGEVPKVSQAADRAWRGQMGADRIWGIQFTCE